VEGLLSGEEEGQGGKAFPLGSLHRAFQGQAVGFSESAAQVEGQNRVVRYRLGPEALRRPQDKKVIYRRPKKGQGAVEFHALTRPVGHRLLSQEASQLFR